MLIPEKINLGDSLLFMLCCREALAGIVESSSLLPADRARSRDFIFNEATDYQIMSLIVQGVLPRNKFDSIDEQFLHMEFKEQVFFSADVIGERFGQNILNNIIFEIGSLYPNYSSTAPILEFLTNVKGRIVVEGPLQAVGASAEKVNRLWSAFKNTPVGKDLSPGSAMRDSEIKKYFTGLLNKAEGNVNAAIQNLKADAEKGWFVSKMERLTKNQGSRYQPREGIKGWWDSVERMAREKGESAKQAISGAISQAQKYAADNPGQAKAGLAIGGAALAALALFASYKTYKRFFSKAAQACKGSGPEKNICMKKYKLQAIKAQIQDLQAAAAGCGKTKQPDKCKATIGNKIRKLQTKAQAANA